MTKLTTIEGIGDVYAKTLQEAGIDSNRLLVPGDGEVVEIQEGI